MDLFPNGGSYSLFTIHYNLRRHESVKEHNMKGNILLTKSKAFALRVVRLYKYLRDRKESVIAKQMLRSGTSIGANISGSRILYSD